MKLSRFISSFLIAAALVANCNSVAAKSKLVPKVYALGVATSFNDNVVYITSLHEIDNVLIDTKTKFLDNRADYSSQLRNYLADQGEEHRTCVIIYALNKKKIDKKLAKLKRKYIKSGIVDIKEIKDFRFTAIKPAETE